MTIAIYGDDCLLQINVVIEHDFAQIGERRCSAQLVTRRVFRVVNFHRVFNTLLRRSGEHILDVELAEPLTEVSDLVILLADLVVERAEADRRRHSTRNKRKHNQATV